MNPAFKIWLRLYLPKNRAIDVQGSRKAPVDMLSLIGPPLSTTDLCKLEIILDHHCYILEQLSCETK